MPDASQSTPFRDIRKRWMASMAPRLRGAETGVALSAALTAYFDRYIKGLYLDCLGPLSDRCALFALGGYGRREMSPFSDVDIMVVVPESQDADILGSVERFIRSLWAQGVSLGHSVRTPSQALELAAENVEVASSLLDARLMAGSPGLFPDPREAVRRILLDGDVDYFELLLTGMHQRRKQFGDSAYLLEPQVKLGCGGLRDLHTVDWVATLFFGTRDVHALVDRGVAWAAEAEGLVRARSLLLRTRFALHLQQGWKQDQLTYAAQAPVGAVLGYGEAHVEGSVTRFMQAYYRSAREAAVTADLWLEAWHSLRPGAPSAALPVNTGAIADDPTVIFDLLAHAHRAHLDLQPQARRAISAATASLPPSVAADSHAARVVRDIVCGLEDPGELLYLVADTGVLAKVVPEWAHLTGHAQHDTYHVFTTDVHLLATTTRMKELLRGELEERTPYLTAVARRYVAARSPDALLLATLLHDVGKGLGADHSIIGAGLAAEVAQRMGFGPEERQLVRRLILDHLVMPKISQRRDLRDPATLQSFCRVVGRVKFLDALTLLSFCDMDSVGPGHLNDWKQRLLEELHREALRHLEEKGQRSDEDLAQRLEVVRSLLERELSPSRVDAILETLPRRFVESSELPQLVRCARFLDDVDGRHRVAFHDAPDGLYTEVLVYETEHPGHLADVAGVLDGAGLDIRGARSAAVVGGGTIEVFEVCTADASHRAIPQRRRELIAETLRRLFDGDSGFEKVLSQRLEQSRLPPRERPGVPLVVSVDNDFDPDFSIIEVKAQDRPGLLAHIARALSDGGLVVDRSLITTEGDRAIDTFYVRDADSKKIAEPRGQELANAINRRLAARP